MTCKEDSDVVQATTDYTVDKLFLDANVILANSSKVPMKQEYTFPKCLWNLFIILSLIKILFLLYSWLQCCVSFWCTTKWISYVYIYPLPLVPPSHPPEVCLFFLLLSQFFVSCPDPNSTVGCKNNVTVSKWAAF